MEHKYGNEQEKQNKQTRRQQDVLLRSPHPLRQAMKKSVVGNLNGKIVMKASYATCMCAAEVKHCSTMHMPILRHDSCPAIGFVFQHPALQMSSVCCAWCCVLLPPSASLCRCPALAPPKHTLSPLSSPFDYGSSMHVRPSGQEPERQEEANCCTDGLGQQGDLLCNAQPNQRPQQNAI